MSKAEKLAAKILSGRSDRNFSFADLCYILERAGFESRPGSGSHRIYYKQGVVEIVKYPATKREREAVPSKTGA